MRAVNLNHIPDMNPDARSRLKVGQEVCCRSSNYGDAEFTSNGVVTAVDSDGIWAEFPRVDRLTRNLHCWVGHFPVGHIGWPVAQHAVRKDMVVRAIETYANTSVSLVGRVSQVGADQIRVGRHLVRLGRKDRSGKARSLRIGEHRS